VPSARVWWGYVVLVSAIAAAVGAAVSMTDSSENAQVLVVASIAAPLVLVAVLGPAFRVMPLLAVGSVAYAVWVWLAARSELELPARDELAAIRLWPVALAWCVAALVAAAASITAIRRAMRRRARRLEKA
jgi:hypothetical protein